jgi:cell division protein FtsZ
MIEYKLETLTPPPDSAPAVSIIGIGGAGSNVLDHIALEGMTGVELITMNCDARSLTSSMAQRKVQLGKTLTQGLGCGGDPELGHEAAVNSIADIRDALTGRRMIFLCVGLGGGTSSGAAPVIARLARETGAFVIVFATMPFVFEGKRRLAQAQAALEGVRQHAHALVCFENDKMGEIVLPKKGVAEAFELANRIICQSVRAVTTVATQPGLIRIGLDDLVTALRNADSRCLFGFGQAKGEARATEALAAALKSPLLDRGQLLEKARNVLVHICGGQSLTLFEIETLMRELHKHVSEEAQILFGAACDEKMGDAVSVTIISSLGRGKVASPFTAVEQTAAPAPPPAASATPAPLLSPHTTAVPILSVQPRQLPPRPGSLLAPDEMTATLATSRVPVLQFTAQTLPVKLLRNGKASPRTSQEPDLFTQPAATEPLEPETAAELNHEALLPDSSSRPGMLAEEETNAAESAMPAVEEPIAEISEPEPAEVFAECPAAEDEAEFTEEAHTEELAPHAPHMEAGKIAEEEEDQEPVFTSLEEEPVTTCQAAEEIEEIQECAAKAEEEDMEQTASHPAFSAEHPPRHTAPMRHMEIPKPAPKTETRKFDLREILQKQRQTRLNHRQQGAARSQPEQPAPQVTSGPSRREVPARPLRMAGTPDPARVTPIRPLAPLQTASPRHASPFLPTRAPAAIPVAAGEPEEAEQTTFDEHLTPVVRAGRFEKTEPTMDNGEDLDIPTFLRRKR